mmetsp:Transcript_128167/g.255954  ORF Transcript_128167/g.255954 Transcript_128167/m.255954 type:complete len:344 (+) Transcript_128167:70-1101(+)
MQRPNAAKWIHFLFLALAVTCEAASGEQPLENSEWPTEDAYRIARQWALQANEEPTPLRPAEDVPHANRDRALGAKAKSKRQLQPHAHDEDTGQILQRDDNSEKSGSSAPSPRTATERPRVLGDVTKHSPLLRQVADEEQQIKRKVAPEAKVANGRPRLPRLDFDAKAELSLARELLGLDAAAWLVQRWDQHVAEAEQLLHESDRLVITPAPLPMQGALETFTVRGGDQRDDEFRQLAPPLLPTQGDLESLTVRAGDQRGDELRQLTEGEAIVATAMSRRAAAAAALRGAAPLTNTRYDGPSPSVDSVQAFLPPAPVFDSEGAVASPLPVAPTAYWGTWANNK